MRKVAVTTLLSVGLLVGCMPGPAAKDVQAWTNTLEHVTPATTPPPVIRNVLNVGIRAGVPVVCPALVSQAAPQFQSFVSATCDAIVKSDDPFTTATQTLPALCAGNPPVGTLVFPKLAPVLTATCPLVLQLPALLKLTQYVPLF